MSKCDTKRREMQTRDNVLTPEGVHPDPEKIKAIQQIPPPTDKKALRDY